MCISYSCEEIGISIKRVVSVLGKFQKKKDGYLRFR
jgi:hypothetical protein